MCQFLFENSYLKTDRNGNLQVLCICVFRFDSATYFNIMFDITNINTVLYAILNIMKREKVTLLPRLSSILEEMGDILNLHA